MLLSIVPSNLIPGMVLQQNVKEVLLQTGDTLTLNDIEGIKTKYRGQEVLVREPRLLQQTADIDLGLIVSTLHQIFTDKEMDDSLPYPLLCRIKIHYGDMFVKVYQQLLDLNNFDATTYRHSVNVAWLSLFIGYQLNLSDEELNDLLLGAILHDIGKLFISGEILTKRSRLTDVEFEEIKRHTDLGYQWVQSFATENVARMVRDHHEKEDGSGYNKGMKKEDIPLEAKIIGVADAFDAITQNRVYRDAMSIFEAYDLLRSDVDKGKLSKTVVEGLETLFDLLIGKWYRTEKGFVQLEYVDNGVVYVKTTTGEHLQMRGKEVI